MKFFAVVFTILFFSLPLLLFVGLVIEAHDPDDRKLRQKKEWTVGDQRLKDQTDAANEKSRKEMR